MLTNRWAAAWGIMVLLCVVVGCTNEPHGHRAVEFTEGSGPTVELPAVEFDSPLTTQELSALVNIARHLPGGDLPQFSSVPGACSLYAPLPEFVAAERHRLAASLNPEWQAEQWRRNAELTRQLDDLGVDPVRLAKSMLRVSCACTALLLESSSEASTGQSPRAARVQRLEQGLDRQLQVTQVVFQRPLTEWQREQQLDAVRETLACLQMARMCAAVSEMNLNIVARHRELLQPLLPATSSMAGFEQRTESQATILQISAEQWPGSMR